MEKEQKFRITTKEERDIRTAIANYNKKYPDGVFVGTFFRFNKDHEVVDDVIFAYGQKDIRKMKFVFGQSAGLVAA